jgi:hypothetical protein
MAENRRLVELLLELLEHVAEHEDERKTKAEEHAIELVKAAIRDDAKRILELGEWVLASPPSAAATISALMALCADLWRMQYAAHNGNVSDVEIIGALDVALKARAEKP